MSFYFWFFKWLNSATLNNDWNDGKFVIHPMRDSNNLPTKNKYASSSKLMMYWFVRLIMNYNVDLTI